MTRISKRTALAGIVLAAGTLGWTSSASAQAPRTWVSSFGDDANPCSRTAPCKTFAGAISKTAAGGEINCVDPGSYGAVTITKSMSIVCQYVEAGVLSMFGSSGMIINVAATDVVYLRGIDYNGAAGPNPGFNGIRVVGAGIVHIEDCLIRNFRAADGNGISIAPSGAVQVTVVDTTVADNGNGAASAGILVRPPTGMAGNNSSARVTLRNVRVQNNVTHQVAVDTTGNNGQGVTLLVDDSQVTGGTNGIAITAPANNANVTAMIVDSFISLGSGSGIIATGTNARARVRESTITSWATGVTQAAGAIINTYGNNSTDGNGAPGAFTLPALPES